MLFPETLALLKKGKFILWKETFAIAQAKRVLPEVFASVVDKNEITVVFDQAKLDEKDLIRVERGWKILTFEPALPFDLVGFLATVSTALAEAGVSLFVISAYSTDHLLVKASDLEKAIPCLERLGCLVEA
jgi:hypothetical protein